MDDVTRSQSKSNFEVDISPPILRPERRSKAQNIGNADGYLSHIFNFRYHFRYRSLSRAQSGCHYFKYWNIKHSFILTADMKRSFRSMQKSIFHDDDVIDDVTGWPQSRPSMFLYEWNNIIFMITKKRTKISLINFLCINITRSWLHLYRYVVMTSLITWS